MNRFLDSGHFWLFLSALFLVTAVALSFAFWGWLITNSETLRNIGFLVAGALAFCFAVWRAKVAERQAKAAQEQASVAQQTLLNERYQRGAEMLGSAVLSVRLGGIYALQRLAEEHPEHYHVQIMRLLCAFVRNPTKDGETVDLPPLESDQPSRTREDVQAVVTAIGSRGEVGVIVEQAIDEFRLDFSGADLRRVSATGANLANAVLTDVDLSGAMLDSANLSGAQIIRTNLSDACFESANISRARLSRANLSQAELLDADLSRARLFTTNVSNAYLDSANLSHAVIHEVKLLGTVLTNTNLTGTNFLRVPSVTLGGQSGIELTQSQLDEARCDPNNPPILNNVLDAETGEPLVWRGRPLVEES